MKNNYKTIYKNSLFLVFYLLTVPNHAVVLNPFIFHTTSLTGLTVTQSEVHGTITDTQGLPLAGVSISVKGSQKGTVSDFNGYYTMKVDDNEVLLFSFIGFKTQEIIVSGRELDIVMETDITDLSTVEINAGYYKVSDRERTGNIARLDAKTIDKQPVNNPLGAMQGHLSGVNIVQSTGVPGGGFSIEIRGKNFINGSTEPLYIVDGVPFGGQSLESISVSSSINAGNVSPLNAINPSDIESIEVLKDADATAIYGSRGANGVVLITTKKGKVGVTRFQANISSTLGQVSHFLDLMNTEQYLELRWEGVANDGYNAFLENPAFDYLWPDLKNWDQNRYTDWQKELLGGTAFRTNTQVSVSGGSEQTQFLVSGGYQNETTVFPGDSNYKKVSVHSQLNHQSTDQRFKFGLSTNYTYEHNKLPRTDFSGVAYRLPPNAPALYDEDGKINWEDSSWDNPLASLEEDYQTRVTTLMANATISYQLASELEFKGNLGYNSYGLESYMILPSSARKPSLGFTPEVNSSITTNSSTRQSWIVEPQLNWKKQWNNLDFDLLVGTSFQQQGMDQLVQRGRGFPNNNLLHNLSAARTLEATTDSNSEYNYHALFGRINIKWKDRYILNLTGRRDGSSRFGPGRQFGNFGALGFAWLFSEEDFLKDNSIVSFGKLRSSYGTTGSDNIGDYQFLDTYNVTGFHYDGTTILAPARIFNPLFGWEVNKKFEVALDLGFLKDRILLNTSWYLNRSSNQLVGIPLATTTGFGSLTGNFDATVENTGLELDLQSINIQNKDFSWRTTFNITFAKNRLVKFPGLETSTFANRYIIGMPLTIVHQFHALGVDPNTGLYLFEDYDGDGVISSLGDRKWVTDMAPAYYGGIGNALTYKNLSLDIFFQFKKQKAFNYLTYNPIPGFNVNGTTALLDRWQQPGDSNPIMRSVSGLETSTFGVIDNQRKSSAAISDGSFIRLRNISITYKLPQQIVKGMDINVYLQGQNLWTWTKYDGPDPEQASQFILPPLRQITLGLQLGF